MKILHYLTPAGREPVREFIEQLPQDVQFEILALLRRMEGGEILTMPHARSISSLAHGLFELRVRDSQGIIRVFYYTKIQHSIFLVHGLRKKRQIIPDKDRLLILKRVSEIVRRNKG